MQERASPPRTGGLAMSSATAPPVIPPVVAPPPQTGAAPFQLLLPGFEGPLDLLLRLIEREKLDISTISLVQVTEQFLRFLRAQVETDAVALADFVAIAARLLLLKSRSLLPRSVLVDGGEPDDAAELVQALREYALFRTAGVAFGERSTSGGRLYPRVAPAPLIAERPLKKLPVEQLLLVMQEVLSRLPEAPPTAVLPPEAVSVADKLAEIVQELRANGVARFFTIVSRCQSRLEVLVSFIAVLHLIRDGVVSADQFEPFGEILLHLVLPTGLAAGSAELRHPRSADPPDSS